MQPPFGSVGAEALAEYGRAARLERLEARDGFTEVQERFCEDIAGGSVWIGMIEHPDVDRVVDACFDVVYAAEAAFRGEPAPKRIRQR